MAVPTYTTDLTLFKDFETAVTFSEFSGFTAGRGQIIDTDYPIQGNSMMSTVMNATGTAGVAVDYGSNITWTNGWAFFIWEVWLAPGTIDSKANGGLVCCIGADISNYREYYVGGNDFGSYPYGGWQNFAVDPQITASATTGIPGTAYRWVGPGVRVLSAVSKGSPLGVDVIRFGRGEFRVVAGETGNFATFAGMASVNDNNSNRWGLFQAIAGGYRFKGLMILGYGAPVYFTDVNRSIVIDNTQYVQSSFNSIEIRNASSVVNWTNILITSLSTVSPGTFAVIDNATLNFSSCTFTDMSTFVFQSNSTIATTTFRRCGQITSGGANFATSIVEGYAGTADTAALIWNQTSDPNGKLDNMDFTKGATSSHAIQFGLSSPTTITMSGTTFTGYNASNGQTDSAILISRTSGTVTINIVNGSTPTYKSAGATVVINNAVVLTITVKDKDSNPIQDAQCYIVKQSDGTTLLNADSLSTGIATTTYNYPGSAVDIHVRIRKSSTGATKYVPFSGVGTITSSGYSLTVTLYQDLTAI